MSTSRGTIAIVGGSGQLARALAVGARLRGLDAVSLSRPRIDLERPQTLAPALDAVRPVLVINAAAFTAVDLAESQEPRAHVVNALAPAEMARWCAASGAWLMHISTDYVFDGSASSPYLPDHPAHPLNAYGRTKAEGEALIRAGLARHLIVRTAWLHDETGRNFLTTMLDLAAGRDEIAVVADQKGTPTYAADLASGLLAMAARVLADPADAPPGTFHLTSAGQTSWYGFAEAIFAAWAARGHKAPRLTPTTTAAWPTPARRPLYSVLDCSATARTFGIALPHWRDGLARCFAARDRA